MRIWAKRFFCAVAVLVFCLCGVCAWAEDAAWAVIDAGDSDRLHLRSAPSSTADSLGLYFTGTQVNVTGAQQGSFVPVRIGTEIGYMHADYLRWGEAADRTVIRQPIGVATPKVGARLRSGPSREHETIGVIGQGEAFYVLGETRAHWYCVKYAGQLGYVSAEVACLVGTVGGLPHVLGDVLLGKDSFMMRGGTKTMGELGACFELEAELTPSALAVLDIDQDGLNEAVVRVSADGDDVGCLVLDLQTEVVYGFAFHYRSMNSLREDGTFSFSSGAMDHGIGWVTFRGPAADVEELARCKDGGSGQTVYMLSGEAILPADFEAFIRTQSEKKEPDWLPVNEETVKSLSD